MVPGVFKFVVRVLICVRVRVRVRACVRTYVRTCVRECDGGGPSKEYRDGLVTNPCPSLVSKMVNRHEYYLPACLPACLPALDKISYYWRLDESTTYCNDPSWIYLWQCRFTNC